MLANAFEEEYSILVIYKACSWFAVTNKSKTILLGGDPSLGKLTLTSTHFIEYIKRLIVDSGYSLEAVYLLF